jgi:hypothetical protein
MAIISLNSVNQLIFVMLKCGVLFEVRTEFINIIYAHFSFKGLRVSHQKDEIREECSRHGRDVKYA